MAEREPSGQSTEASKATMALVPATTCVHTCRISLSSHSPSLSRSGVHVELASSTSGSAVAFAAAASTSASAYGLSSLSSTCSTKPPISPAGLPQLGSSRLALNAAPTAAGASVAAAARRRAARRRGRGGRRGAAEAMATMPLPAKLSLGLPLLPPGPSFHFCQGAAQWNAQRRWASS